MILVDTSVWVEHLRDGTAALAELLTRELVLCHPLVIGELACGNLPLREHTLFLLSSLPRASLAPHDDVMQTVSEAKLHGRGMGWIDIHLLCAARSAGSQLWTLDRSLASAAKSAGVKLF